ncbi:MAG: PEP/pyruvate-binding domain-containing protein, partial [Mariprofundus sp.]|nr:PEP/pyruvate-binding domain-containing protein [Mariprofundus sp.]
SLSTILSYMIVRFVLIFFLALFVSGGVVWSEVDVQTGQFRSWIDQFKQSPRGPFDSVNWFCKDGLILPPKKYACREHGGGIQHGVWNFRTILMRENGYLVGNLLSAIKPEDFTGPDAQLDDLKQILLEQFLVRVNDGWVFRQARFYRGAIQAEAEQDAASKILLAMLGDPVWLTSERFLLLREAARLLPLSVEPALGVKIRQAASDISEKDNEFQALRVKIHSLPDRGDSASVRAYARNRGQVDLQGLYESLATDLDALYAPRASILRLKKLAAESTNQQFKQKIAETIDALHQANGMTDAIAVATSRSLIFRNILLHKNSYTVYNRLRLLRASLILEQEIYVLGNQLIKISERTNRATRLGWLRYLGDALHATGLLSDRQWQSARSELKILIHNDDISVHDYYTGLRYLARVSEWAQRTLEFHFNHTVNHWQHLTPLALNFMPERLRSSPLLPFTRILDSLVADAGRLSGIKHRVFGQEIATGLRALNPGIRRGILLQAPAAGEDMQSDGIYMLDATRQELKPVAGIITRGEGSSVSHVQLLARNLGIPNMVVDDTLFATIKAHIGERIVMAISYQGMISIEPYSSKWDAVFGKELIARDIITVDLRKLNLADTELRPLDEVRARDSGRTVGPKAANLGELFHYYPDMVNAGIVLPFGVFRRHLDQPFEPGGPSVFEWMQSEYRRLALISSTPQRSRETRLFLANLRQWIINSDPGEPIREQLRSALQHEFGEGGRYGLFVRSDTNVEDLPGFSGAGLNLTVPNVVGFENIVTAILRVWASPFTDRAFAWRQSYMRNPEHVYPAVLLMKSFASEKSGVLVTSNVDNGDRQWISIATNEGVGGAVEGQAAEELRVQRSNGMVKLLAQASAPERAGLNPQGGMIRQAASGREYVLLKDDIEQLRSLVADMERRFPLPRNGDGLPVVADIEFGFRHGKMALFQIRPFVESRRASRSLVLVEMDRQLFGREETRVQLDQSPVVSDGLR